MTGMGGGAGGTQPPGPGSGASGEAGKGMPGLADAAGGGAGAGGASGAMGAGPEKSPAGGSGGAGGGGSSGLGAGGTSAARKGGPEENMKGVGKGAAAVAAVPAAGIAAQLMVFAMFLSWLKGMMAAMVAMAANLMSMIAAMFMAAVNAMVGAIMAVGAGIAAAVGGAISATTGAIAAVGLSLLALIGIGAGAAAANGSNTTAQRDSLPPDCRPATEAAVREIDESLDENVDKKMEDMAEQVFSVLAGWGMPDENIAGVLGNFQGESGIDPTAIESIEGEDFKRKKQKKEAEKNGFKAEDILPQSYREKHDTIKLVGIGLGQWTNSRNTLLTEYSEANDLKWYEFETQMQFLVSGDEDRYIRVVDGLINDPDPSISESTTTWMHHWEVLRGQPKELEKRIKFSEYWFAKMADWEADVDLADSILEQAEASISEANENRRDTLVAQCRTANAGGVVTIGELMDCGEVGGLHADACTMHEELQDEFGAFFKVAYGQRNEDGSNHNNGQAIDYMINTEKKVPSQKEQDSAVKVIDYVIANHEELNITGILWQKKKWNPTMDPVGKWDDVAGKANKVFGDITQDHIDHIHISVGPDKFM